MGDWQPSAAFFRRLIAADDDGEDISRPYPFYLASPLQGSPAALGAPQEWLAEWKWDGIRAQLIRRGGATFLWSRGEELVSARFPEVVEAAAELPDGTVLDGEIVAWGEGGVRPFAELQRRLGRKRLDARLLAQIPVRLLAYDCLELGGRDMRQDPQVVRRAALETVLAGSRIDVSPLVAFADWQALEPLRDSARQRAVEGLMLKRGDGRYEAGRRRGGWWKWKVDPLSVDAVLVYAQAGHGRRAALFTDYTFAVPDEDGELRPVAKAYSGLSDSEIRALDHWIRRNTVERFGPVRAVRPEQVFELAFDGIAESSRHKAGLSLRFPRIRRWRRGADATDADTLKTLRALLAQSGAQGGWSTD